MKTQTIKAETMPSITMVGEVVTTYKRKGLVRDLPKISSSREANDLLRQVWTDSLEHYESFYVLFMNRANKVIGYGLISTGGVAGTVADPKIIFQKALLANASGMILAHNHPSGNLTASRSDIDLTRKLKEAGKVLEVQVLDHVILTEDNKYFSFADEGMM